MTSENDASGFVEQIKAMYAHEVKITRAASAWFDGKRPKDWTLHRHAANPLVNCSTQREKDLAQAVADMVTEELADHPGRPKTVGQLHAVHYQSCNCLADSAICCLPACPCKQTDPGRPTTKEND